ncbi:MAG: hypothetical protein IPL18_05910 [Sphingomonadales bacterium]|nr:hypothetical protein [Sphingomonadales bacterium]
MIGALYLVAFQSLNFLIGFFFNQLRRSVGGSFNILRFGFERGGFIFSYHLFGGFSRAFLLGSSTQADSTSAANNKAARLMA